MNRTASLGTLLAIAVLLGASLLVVPAGPLVGARAPDRGAPAPGNLTFARGWDAALQPYAANLTQAAVHGASTLTNAEIARAFNGTPYANLSVADVRTALAEVETFQVSLGTYFGGFLAGCAIGGAIGSLASPAGAAVGCVVGGAVTDLAIYFLSSSATSAAQAVELQFQLGQIAAFYNSILYSNGLVTMTQSVLNSTDNAWASMADAAALQQLPNVTFDPLWDMNASGVAFQIATLAQDYANAAGAAGASISTAQTASYAPGGRYASTCNYALTGTFQVGFTFGCLASGTAYYSTWAGGLEGSAVNGTGLQFNQGGQVYVACTGGSGPVWINTDHPTPTSYHFEVPEDGIYRLFAAPYTAVFVFHAPAGASCDLVGAGFVMVPPGLGSPTTQVVMVACGYQSRSACNPYNQTTAAFKSRVQGSMVVVQTRGGSGDQSPVYTVPGTTSSFFTQISSLMVTAATSGQTYWLFLHTLGYNSTSQVPSNCVIPMPSQTLPSQYDSGLGTLSLNQSLSMYEAWMNGLATFFATPSGPTNFCSGHAPFSVGLTSWNLNTIVTGWVFTTPQAHQNFGQVATWTVTNASVNATRVGNTSSVGLRSQPTPIVLWPATKTLYAKIGSVQLVPVDAPLDLFVPANGTFYQLYGNGTAAGTRGFSNGSASATVGAAIFISTCKILTNAETYVNAPGGYCPLLFSSIANVSFNLTCSPSDASGDCGAAPVPFVGSCGVTFPIVAQLVGLWAGLTGSSGFGCTLAIFLGVVTTIVLVFVVVYVIYRLVRAAGDARGGRDD